jgi:hypothetical protein
MIKIKTANAIKTSSEIKSYRSLRHAVAAPLGSIDCGRTKMGYAKRMEKQDYKIWFQAGTQSGLKKRVVGR